MRGESDESPTYQKEYISEEKRNNGSICGVFLFVTNTGEKLCFMDEVADVLFIEVLGICIAISFGNSSTSSFDASSNFGLSV